MDPDLGISAAKPLFVLEEWMAEEGRAGTFLWLLMAIALGGGYIAWKSASLFGHGVKTVSSPTPLEYR